MRFLSTAFYMLLSILGLSVISLGGLIGIQIYRGKLSPTDLHSILRVIGGTHRIMIPNDAYTRYLAFAKDEAKARAELEMNRGFAETREPAALRLQEERNALQGEADLAKKQLAEEMLRVENIRNEVEAQKKMVAELRRALDDERKKNLTVEQDAATQKLRKMLSEMDAGDIGVFLSTIVRDPSRGGPTEAARIVRDHLKADFSAEVMGEMQQQDRQEVIPLVENRFAGVPADAVVKIFTDNKLSAGEIMVYLAHMNPMQALGVYLRLPPALQEQISPQWLRNS